MASRLKYAKKLCTFFGNATSIKIKDLKDSVTIARQAGRPLHVIGDSKRYSLKNIKAGEVSTLLLPKGADLTFYRYAWWG